MKHKRIISALLIASTLASVFQLTSCKQRSTSENPFDTDAVTTVKDGLSDAGPNTGFDANKTHGEKILYGKKNINQSRIWKIGEPLTSILRVGDMLIGETNYSNKFGYYTFDEPNNARLLCFDPLCVHLPSQESCTAYINYDQLVDNSSGMTVIYNDPMGMYVDLYENAEAPVIYLFYRRDDTYTINFEEQGTREPVYCIERFDMSEGKRLPVLDNEENTIIQACNYGDYVYYVLDKGDKEGQTLCRIHKSGGNPEAYDLDEKAESLFIIDVADDMFYYMIDEQYLYRSELDLTDSEMVLDLSTLKGKDGSVGVMQGAYSGYFYYLADVETVTANNTTGERANLYRIPMDDLTKTPEIVVEGMNGAAGTFIFSEKTLYYTPYVYEFTSVDSEEMLTAVNECDGKLYALDLESGESKLIVENSGMTIYPKFAWDDMVIFSGWAYNSTGSKYSENNENLLIAYASGEPFEIWCRKDQVGKLSEEYLEDLRAASKAAREEYDAKQNDN